MLNRNLTRAALPVVVLIVFTSLYLSDLLSTLMDGDERTDMDKAWHLSKGRQPGVDYVAEQQPISLLIGGAIVRIFGHSATALRLLAAVQVLLGSCVLGPAVRRLWGELTAALAVGLLFGSGLVTGELLIDRIGTDGVRMVLVQGAGGTPEPHQLVSLGDHDRFGAYLSERFRLLTVFDRAGQQIEVYQRVNGASE